MEVELMMFVNSVQKKVQTKWESDPFENYEKIHKQDSSARNFIR